MFCISNFLTGYTGLQIIASMLGNYFAVSCHFWQKDLHLYFMINKLKAEARCGYFQIYEHVNPCTWPIKVYRQQGLTIPAHKFEGLLESRLFTSTTPHQKQCKIFKGQHIS